MSASRIVASARLALAALLCLPAIAMGGIFEPCAEGVLRCGTVTVPLDRTGRIAGEIPLQVQRLKVRGERQGTLLFLFGGPGQAGVQPDASFHQFIADIAPGYEIVTFDQRGTGRSGLLRCPDLERARKIAAPGELEPTRIEELVAGCAAFIGPRRSSYGTVETVEDIEAVRQKLGARKLTLFGVSYGTFVATAYARVYPTRVARLVLDSTVDEDPPDTLDTSILEATPRVLRELCAGGRCRGVTTDPVRDLVRLQRALQRRRVQGAFVGSDGRLTPRVLGGSRQPALLLEILLNGDLGNGAARRAWPGAARAALAGDYAPLMRLAGPPAEAEIPPQELSDAISIATACTDSSSPWGAATTLPDRQAALEAAVARLPDRLRLGLSIRALARAFGDCAAWPDAPRQPSVLDPLPAVPTLLVNGTWDLRTAIEGARRVARRIPGARIVPVPFTGHSPISTQECVQTVVRRFLTDAPLRRPCAGIPHPGRAWPIPPRSVSALQPVGAPGGPGRTAAAVLETIGDLGRAAAIADTNGGGRFPGLRGGRAESTFLDLRLRDVEYVPGVLVSGRIESTGQRLTGSITDTADRFGRVDLVVRGPAAAKGRLTRQGNAIVGTLSGVAVRFPASKFGAALQRGFDQGR